MIKQLQTDLHLLGYDPGAIDGLWGPSTRGACHDAKDDHPTLPEVTSPPSQAFIDAVHALVVVPAAPVALPPQCLDLSAQASTGWTKKARPWGDVRGITLHQTGCPMSEQPSRWLGLKAHYGVTYSGKIYRVRKETDFGWHAQGQSHHNVGIEIAGFFAGVEGDPKTRPNGPAEWGTQSVTEAQIQATSDLIDYLVALVAHNGGRIQTLDPHRCATDSRRPDPGSKVWQRIALPAQLKHRLTSGKVTGRGMPIPEAWDGRCVGVPY
jgi:hypothetical protein